ncbi:putative ATPase [Rhodothalassium salexigens DSM 2132]|uniref:Replication-associated recombination protein A n=1 Tax=Rhodothalassium salexigens DSM 2132 TaxID=1188247 RepID=A0A4R2PCD4_RHOSA|nr:replication-associated recombination protein A [Rhodothalassium salexigens]MBB4212365.1 putative ATPase [Rhodothalassium salexigens DSM 2132]MBK1637789.1 AAA family ATPase [Rhodothalassium salexigens DSM 2132]TCP32004.1 putative ATPase [Rhodothalassium salexigens DSM 2132]
MSDLFEQAGMAEAAPRPLADRLRPTALDQVVGQDHLLGAGAPLARMVETGHLGSLVLWGPPGTGKTTIARLLAERTGLAFTQVSAIGTGVAELRKVFDQAAQRRRTGQGTLLFVDEIHRFNRAQQDSFLPHVEDGTVTLVGATTENPSFELNAALLSRMQVLVLKRLDDAALDALLARAEAHMGRALPLTHEARAQLKAMADGDGRYALTTAAAVFDLAPGPLDPAGLAELIQHRAPHYDKDREEHYNLISALHKALRGSDPDAALYWLARMLSAGEDPLYVARRLIRFASEDIGLADPAALTQALAARQAYEVLGSPEGELAIVQATLYLATAPKSNAAYAAQKAAWAKARATGSLMPPKHILNAPTGLMKDLGYGKGYAYDHDTEQGFSGQDYFPDEMAREQFYRPRGRGYEARVAERLAGWERLRAKAGQDGGR